MKGTRVGEYGPRVCGLGTHEVWQTPITQGRATTKNRVVDQDVPPMRVTSPPSVTRLCSVWGSPAREVGCEGVSGPLRRSPGEIGVVPLIPPCNLGRQDASQTVRDGDAVGGATQGETSSLVDVTSPSWASQVEGADGTEAHVVQDDFPAGSPAGGSSWASLADDFPQAADPSDPMLGDPFAYSTDNINRDHDSWRESLRQELVLAQGYFVGWDSLEFLDFRPGQLSHEHKRLRS